MSYFLRFPSFVIYAENTIESIRQKLMGEQTAKETIKGGLMKVKREWVFAFNIYISSFHDFCNLL